MLRTCWYFTLLTAGVSLHDAAAINVFDVGGPTDASSAHLQPSHTDFHRFV